MFLGIETQRFFYAIIQDGNEVGHLCTVSDIIAVFFRGVVRSPDLLRKSCGGFRGKTGL